MKDKQFEHIIKTKLSGFISQESPDWELFLEKKQIADAADSSTDFDKEVKDKLDSYQTSSAPQWAKFMTHKASQEATEQSDNTDNFDEQVMESLEGMESRAVPAWAAFVDFKETAATPQDIAFDNEVTAKLDSYEVTGAPQWSVFQDFKATYEAEAADAHFDARIQDELDEYESDRTPNWQEYLDYKFDHSVDAIVGDYSSESAPQWQKFQEKKKREEVGIAEVFDKNIASNLGRQEAAYNSQHWLMLKERLAKIAYYRKQIFSYKALEMLFVSLLLFTLGNHFHLVQYDAVPVVEYAEATPEDKKKETILNEAEANLAENVAENIQLTNASQPLVATTTETTKTPIKQIATQQLASRQTSSSVSASSLLADATTKNTLTSIGSTANNIPGNSTTLTAAPSSTTNDNNNQALAIDKLSTSVSSLDALALLDIEALDAEDALPETSPLVYGDPFEKKKFLDEGLWIHAVNSMDNSYITTPYNQEIDLAANTHQKYGYSGQLLISKVFKKTEIETGLAYSSLTYTPYDRGEQLYTTSTGNVRSINFSKISLDLVSIPVNMKYHFMANGRWSIYGGLGLSNDFIVKTGYELTDELEFRVPTPGPIEPTAADLPDFYQREFTEGFFGNLPELPDFVTYRSKANNYILRGMLSLGAERNVSDNFAVYLNATYFHTLYNDQIGPYNDKLDKLSFGMGFKLKVGK